MEPLIDYNYIRRIAYMDELLMEEMVQNWVLDMKHRLTIFEQSFQSNSPINFFKIIHEIKTSFLIIGSAKGIKYCELLILNLSKNDTITQHDSKHLNLIYMEIVEIIDK